MRNLIITILWITTCLLSVIDTHLFVYPSLSRSLLMETGLLALAVIALVHLWVKKDSAALSHEEVFVLLWIGYVFVHYVLTDPHETYRTFYLMVSLSCVLTLSMCIQQNLLTQKTIEDGLILIALVHLLFIIGQTIGWTDSLQSAFPLTGSNENPTVTALYLVGTMPILMKRLQQTARPWLYIVLMMVCVVSICALRCRTAYIGLSIEVVVWWTLSCKERKTGILRFNFRNVAIAILVAVMAFVAGTRLYGMKKDSADGRILIWKISAMMIAEHPQGYGYGLFDKTYNHRQAIYLSEENPTAVEKRNASYVYMPYNDYLEQGVEGGIIAMLFLIGFYTIMLRKSFRYGRKMEAAVFAAFGIMSLTNFVYGSIQPWLLLMCCACFISVEEDKTSECRTNVGVPILYVSLLLPFACMVGSMTLSQMSLKRLEDKVENKTDEAYARLENTIGTSECYWTHRATACMNAGHPSQALAYARHAQQYTSSPETYSVEAECFRRIGDLVSCMNALDTLSNMMPRKLGLKRILMRYHHSAGHPEKALRYAHEILSTEVKTRTKETDDILHEARIYVNACVMQEKNNNHKE